MCETRNANRSSREEEGEGNPPRRRRRVRPRGSGPRSNRREDGQNWVLERNSKPESDEQNDEA